MDNFIFTVNAVLPLFLIMAFGYIVREKGWLQEGFRDVFNKFCFDFAIPCSLFKAAYNSNIKENFNPTLVGALLAGVFLETLLVCLVFPLFVKDRPKLGSMIQGSIRTNAVIFGLALGRNLFGEENMLPVTIMVAFTVPVLSVICVIILSICGERGGAGVTPLGIIKQVFTNRIILGTVVGLIFSVFEIKLPQMIYSPINEVASCAGALAMMALGAQFSFGSARKNLFYNALTVVFRLLVIPLIAVPGMYFFGFRGPELGAMFILFASPTATATYVMSKNMGCDGDLAGEIVVFTTFFSLFTIFGGVYLMRSLGLI